MPVADRIPKGGSVIARAMGMANPAAVRDAVTLSLFLTDHRRRAVLEEGVRAHDPEPADQRRPDLPALAAQLDRLPPRHAERAACRAEAERVTAAAAAAGIVPVGWHDERYPPLLATIDDPPAVLWVRGDPAVLQGPAVAIVGSRSASPYALMVAEQLGADLGRRGVTVVSGLARGVDAAAHGGALAVGGPTAAVLGSGVDVVYPREHAGLMARIAVAGALVSEWGPGVRPLAYRFPLRNRLISGLSSAVVVVEAASRSGSLITARHAADQGRDVMAVPGNVLSGRNGGAHALIRDGATIVESADDILDELGPCAATPPAGARAVTAVAGRPPASESVHPEESVLRHMDPGDICDVDGLAARSGLASGELLASLTALELGGRVKRVGPGRFVRVPGRW